MKRSIKTKLLLGYGVVLLLMASVAIFTYYKVAEIDQTQIQLTELRQPSVVAGMNLNNGINITMASLRGYMILGSDPEKAEHYKAKRQQAWQLIDTSTKKFDRLAETWKDQKKIQQLHKLEALLDEFRGIQQEIEDIAQSPANIPALDLLETKAYPAAYKASETLEQMIEDESQQKSSPERQILQHDLAVSLGSLNLSIADVRAVLLNGLERDYKDFDKQWKKNQAAYEKLLDEQYLLTPHEKELFQSYVEARQKYKTHADSILQQRQEKNWNRSSYWLSTKAAPKATAIETVLQQMRQDQESLMAAETQWLTEHIHSLTYVMLIATAIASLAGIAIALILSRNIVNSIREILWRTKAIAQGNLCSAPLHLKSGDELQELAEATNTMGANLCQLIHQVNDTTVELAAASEQLIEASSATANSMEKQQTASDNVEQAMSEVKTTVESMAHNAALAADAAHSADKNANNGHSVVSHNLAAIGNLAKHVESATGTINSLGKDAEGVDEIVQVISSIAEQTNLLALNAAIESARAGEQGRGFAVVADEVRTLAARTQDSTEQISTLLERLKNGSQEAVRAMAEGEGQVQATVEGAEKTSQVLQNIIDSVSTITSMNTQIASATEEQNVVALNMGQSIHQISKESKQAQSNTLDTDSAAKQVGKHATDLNKLVKRFMLPEA